MEHQAPFSRPNPKRSGWLFMVRSSTGVVSRLGSRAGPVFRRCPQVRLMASNTRVASVPLPLESDWCGQSRCRVDQNACRLVHYLLRLSSIGLPAKLCIRSPEPCSLKFPVSQMLPSAPSIRDTWCGSPSCTRMSTRSLSASLTWTALTDAHQHSYTGERVRQ